MDSVSYAVGFSLSPFFLKLMFVSKLVSLKVAELVIGSSCLQSARGCTDDCHWITLILKKTLKSDESQASSAVIRRAFL